MRRPDPARPCLMLDQPGWPRPRPTASRRSRLQRVAPRSRQRPFAGTPDWDGGLAELGGFSASVDNLATLAFNLPPGAERAAQTDLVEMPLGGELLLVLLAASSSQSSASPQAPEASVCYELWFFPGIEDGDAAREALSRVREASAAGNGGADRQLLGGMIRSGESPVDDELRAIDAVISWIRANQEHFPKLDKRLHPRGVRQLSRFPPFDSLRKSTFKNTAAVEDLSISEVLQILLDKRRICVSGAVIMIAAPPADRDTQTLLWGATASSDVRGNGPGQGVEAFDGLSGYYVTEGHPGIIIDRNLLPVLARRGEATYVHSEGAHEDRYSLSSIVACGIALCHEVTHLVAPNNNDRNSDSGPGEYELAAYEYCLDLMDALADRAEGPRSELVEEDAAAVMAAIGRYCFAINKQLQKYCHRQNGSNGCGDCKRRNPRGCRFCSRCRLVGTVVAESVGECTGVEEKMEGTR